MKMKSFATTAELSILDFEEVFAKLVITYTLWETKIKLGPLFKIIYTPSLHDYLYSNNETDLENKDLFRKYEKSAWSFANIY